MRFEAALAAAVSSLSIAAAAGPEIPAGDPYYVAAQQALSERRAAKPMRGRAKNVILFIADGMDPTTVAAARIYDGQTRGENGEENLLAFEKFPHLAMAKTYNTNAQTPDSAGTATAMLSGVKTKMGVIGVSDAIKPGDCASTAAAKVATLAELAERAGLATGVISTARLTHATPASVYAHAADRDWESDADLPESAKDGGCPDIARQFIEFPYGDGIEVALGGGRSNFMPATEADPEYPERAGRRQDGRNLINEWIAKPGGQIFVWNKSDFDRVDPASSPRLLGLFEPSHMQYEMDRSADAAGEPSLSEMTAKAIEILSKDRDGYFLMVEAGRVDHAHHGGNAARALSDTQAFSEAIALARAKTSEKDTLIIATADHGHTLAFQGYPKRGNNILGLADASLEGYSDEEGYALAGDKKRYTTLVYANGPGSVFAGELGKGGRPEPTPQEVADPAYRQQALILGPAETHGGQDVTVYASGPHAYLFAGVVEQNYTYHVITDALDLVRRAGGK